MNLYSFEKKTIIYHHHCRFHKPAVMGPKPTVMTSITVGFYTKTDSDRPGMLTSNSYAAYCRSLFLNIKKFPRLGFEPRSRGS